MWRKRLRFSRERLLSSFVLTVRVVLGLVFIMSSVPKIRQPYIFLGNVFAYELVGPDMGVLVAVVLPWLELLVGLCLLSGMASGGALLASTGLGVLFAFVLASALWRHLDISCGCFSTSSTDKITYLSLIRAIVIALGSAAAYGGTLLLQARPSGFR